MQVKTNHAASQIGFRGQADLILVLHVHADGECEELYFGPFAPVKAASRHSGRDNKDMIAVSKLKAMRQVLNSEGVDAAVRVAAQIPDDKPLVTED